MKRCFELAAQFKGCVRTNPLVGAVIVHNDRIVSEGAHQLFGSAHAEVNAISQITDQALLPDAALFVSLEPCFHVGKTPPCVNLILDKKIPEVYISCTDPFDKVAGKSIQLLNENGISVHSDIADDEGRELIRPFVRGISSRRPYIILKYAQSADGKIGLKDRQVWLTNAYSKILAHKWRAEADAVLVGTNTALLDNPKLDNRLYFGKRQCLRVVIDRDLKIPTSHHLMDGSAPTIVLTNERKERTEVVEYLYSDFEGNYLFELLEHLYAREVGVLVIEGGAQVLQSFIDANLWDEARVFTVRQPLGEQAVSAPILKNDVLIKKRFIADDILCQYFNGSLA